MNDFYIKFRTFISTFDIYKKIEYHETNFTLYLSATVLFG